MLKAKARSSGLTLSKATAEFSRLPQFSTVDESLCSESEAFGGENNTIQ